MTGPDVIPVELTALTPAVIALVLAVRKAGLTDRWTPLVAIGLGIAGAVAISLTTGTIGVVPAIFGGAVIGSAATGLHQVSKQWSDEQ